MPANIGARGRTWFRLLPRGGAHRYCKTRQMACNGHSAPCGVFLIFRPDRCGAMWRRCCRTFAGKSWTLDPVRSLIDRWFILMRPTWQSIRRRRNPISDTKHLILATSEEQIWPVEDASVDFILCTETLEHVLDTRQFLAEASRSLRAGGTILLTVPFAARWHFIPYDYWRFTPSSMDYLLREAGFADVRIYARGNSGTVACYKVMALVLPLLATKNSRAVLTWLMRIAGLCLAPVLVVFAVLANASLLGRGGNDCLGYTAIAQRTGVSDCNSSSL